MTPIIAVEYRQGIEDAWSNVATFIPKLIGFLLVLVIGYFIVKAISKLASAALERVGFDKAVERGGIKQALASSKYDASDIVGKIIFYALFLFVLQLAFGTFGTNPVSDLIEGVIAYLPKLFAAIVIIVLAAAIAAAVRELIDATLGGLPYGKALGNVAAAFIIGFGIFAALDQLQVAEDIVRTAFQAVMFAIAGIAVVAVGGGGIGPMRQRWEQALNRIDEEAPRIKEQRAGAKQRIEQRVQDRTEQVQSSPGAQSSR
jgi:hypothetical protein